jgi:hypothetical protein
LHLTGLDGLISVTILAGLLCSRGFESRDYSIKLGVHLFSISGSEFMEMFVGVGAARVRDHREG